MSESVSKKPSAGWIEVAQTVSVVSFALAWFLWEPPNYLASLLAVAAGLITGAGSFFLVRLPLEDAPPRFAEWRHGYNFTPPRLVSMKLAGVPEDIMAVVGSELLGDHFTGPYPVWDRLRIVVGPRVDEWIHVILFHARYYGDGVREEEPPSEGSAAAGRTRSM
ncbi:MAG TPA: hypothetical protein VF698_08285 [Thermoanaerobaculia bacterium]|jgi:hypothetical protein